MWTLPVEIHRKRILVSTGSNSNKKNLHSKNILCRGLYLV